MVIVNKFFIFKYDKQKVFIMIEIWKDVKNFETSYQVSNLGNVRSKDRIRNNVLYKSQILSPMSNGVYLFVQFNNPETKLKYRYYIHRLVAEHFPEICGEWFDGCVVDHIDTNVLNNSANNLRVCTIKENVNNPISKLKNEKSHRSNEYRDKMRKLQVGKNYGLYKTKDGNTVISFKSAATRFHSDWKLIKNL